jgi:hypothetical protein
MAKRRATLIIKNNSIPSAPFTGTTLLQGEGIVNTADGIMMFSGVTQSTSEWTPAGTGGAASFFEVGSNLYDLRLRNRITKYENISGAGLVNKFLSGTTAGFVLADISAIQGVDSYVTGGTYNPTTDTITLTLSEGKPNVNITGITDNFTTGATLIGSTAYFNRNDTLSAYTLDLSTFISTGDTYVTAYTYSNNVFTIARNQGLPNLSVLMNAVTGLTVNGNLTVTGNTNVQALTATTISATTYYNLPVDVYVTGGTVSRTNNNTSLLFTNNTGGTFNVSTIVDTFVTGGTYNTTGGTITFTNNSGNTFNVTGITGSDTFTTAFTYSNNVFTIKQNQGQPDLTALINTMTGLTINGNLTVTGTTSLSGLSYYYQTVSGTNPKEIANVEYVTAYTQTNDVYVTGATYTGATNNTNNTSFNLLYHGTPLNGPYSLNGKDTFITGTTWTPNILTSKRNDGAVFNTTIDTFSALTITNDLNVGGNTIIQGSLTVFGPSISAFTSQLYVEDPNITLNYNPTGSTVATSLCAGWTVQDGNGIAGGDVFYNIRAMNAFTGLTPTEIPDITEYTGANGFENRAWVTQLNDIVIRNTDDSCTAPNGVRVLAEWDILDGGSF